MVCGLDRDWPRPKTIKLGLGQAKSVVKVADNCLSRPLTGLAIQIENEYYTLKPVNFHVDVVTVKRFVSNIIFLNITITIIFPLYSRFINKR